MAWSGRGLTSEEEKFYAAMINKENQQRLGWFIKHGGHHEMQQLLNEEKAEPIIKSNEKITIPNQAVKDKIKPDLLETSAVMRPVEENVKNILYSGTSSLGGGRKKYLQTRCEKSPKEKYYFAESKNWEYGWAVDGEGFEEFRAQRESDTQNGRVAVIQDSFYRRGGVGMAEDSNHYRPPVNMKALFPPPTL